MSDNIVPRLRRQIEQLRAINKELMETCEGLLSEWDRLTHYGSPMAKSASERVKRARSITANSRDFFRTFQGD